MGVAIAVGLLALLLDGPFGIRERALEVTATAYNSLPGQTAGDPEIGAWGDRLRAGDRALAVSRDLEAMGLVRGVRVRIDGWPGAWTVRDRMAPRWRRRIDLHMGKDVEAARAFGRRRVRIRWRRGDAPVP